MNRRAFATNFAKVAFTLAAAGNFLAIGSCGSNIYAAIEKYVPVGLNAFSAIVNILSSAGVLPLGSGTVIQLLMAETKAAFADITIAVQQYQNAPAADKATLLGKISTALADAEANLQLFWSNLNLPAGSIASLVEGLLQIIVSTLMGLGTQLPAAAITPAHTALMERRASSARLIAAPPQKRSVEQFKKDFNQRLISANQGQYAI